MFPRSGEMDHHTYFIFPDRCGFWVVSCGRKSIDRRWLWSIIEKRQERSEEMTGSQGILPSHPHPTLPKIERPFLRRWYMGSSRYFRKSTNGPILTDPPSATKIWQEKSVPFLFSRATEGYGRHCHE